MFHIFCFLFFTYSQWSLALQERLCTSRRAWSGRRCSLLHLPHRDLQHPHGILHMQWQGWLQPCSLHHTKYSSRVSRIHRCGNGHREINRRVMLSPEMVGFFNWLSCLRIWENLDFLMMMMMMVKFEKVCRFFLEALTVLYLQYLFFI